MPLGHGSILVRIRMLCLDDIPFQPHNPLDRDLVRIIRIPRCSLASPPTTQRREKEGGNKPESNNHPPPQPLLRIQLPNQTQVFPQRLVILRI
jgi:hypothetical protein